MRKILFIVLAIVLVLLLCAGCNNSSRIDDDDFDDEPITIAIGGASDADSDDASDDDSDDASDDDSNIDNDEPDDGTPDGWPIELPPYPDGVVDDIYIAENGNYSISIINTSKATMEKYAETMINAGWECTDTEDDLMKFNNGEYGVMLLLLNGEILSINMGKNSERLEQLDGWPADRLPQGFPEYPDGDIYSAYANVESHGKPVALYICIERSSKETFEKYKAALKDAGWELEDFGDERILGNAGYLDYECWSIEKDGVSGLVEFYNPGGVFILEIN